ncbi:MAG: isocitrate lyase/PEP mutase family protein [Rhodospirillales bacterium]|nr:isocitrate lyase/PEP mutase family protein [Rhodospirillales bacterium]
MDWSRRREAFRAVLAGSACVHPGSVHDPISARIAEELGFEVGMFAGSIASFTVLGAPDVIVLTLSEFAAQALRINRAVADLPLLVDADHGYGNALNVMRTVEELEIAGVAGMSIEDTALPRVFGEKGASLLSLEEGVGKMRAALAARQDRRLAIFGRTSAIAINGIADAIARARAYQEAGVDGLFFAGAMTRADVDAMAEAVRLPIVLGGVSADLQDKAYLASRGVRIALQGHQPFSAAVQAIHDTLKALREGVKPAELTGIASAAMMKRLTREAQYDAAAKDYLG